MAKLLTAVGAALVLMAPQARAEEKAAAGKELVGGYMIVSGEKDGKAEPEERVKGSTVLFTEDTITVTDKDKKQAYVATYKLDAKSKPWVITMTATAGEGKGKETRGLVETTDGGGVRLIYSLPGGDLPKGFKTADRQLMFTLKKLEKAKDK
jgi:uncharacterized protein (TIGR03067 family)